MKKLFAIIFAVCFMLGGCQKEQSPAPETNSVNESTISESFDDKSQSPATKQKEEIDKQIIDTCFNAANEAGSVIDVKIEDDTVYYMLISGLDCTDAFVSMMSSGDYSEWEGIKENCNELCRTIMTTVKNCGADYDVVLGIMGTVLDDEVVVFMASQNGEIIYDFLEEVLNA